MKYKEALWRGSKGEEVKERSTTEGRLQERTKDQEGGRFRKNDFKSLVRKGEFGVNMAPKMMKHYG